MRLSDDKLEEVRQAADIVEVVGEHVRLKRQGVRYVGLCPFHKEKSPSFSVDPANRLFYCFGCVAADEPVWTGRGLIPIGHVVPGDTVVGIDGCVETVTAVAAREKSLVGIALDVVARDPLRLSPDHTCLVVRAAEAHRAVPMLMRGGGGVRFYNRRRTAPPQEIAVEALPTVAVHPGDYVLFPVVPDASRAEAPLLAPPVAVLPSRGPAARPVPSLPVTPRTARLLGLWLAEGSTYRGGARWSFGATEGAFADEVIATLADLGLPSTRHDRPDRSLIEVTCSSTALAALLEHHFGTGAADKRIPAQVLRWTVEAQRALLGGYMDGDGHIPAYATPTDRPVGRATSISAALVRGLFAVAVQARCPVSMSRDSRPTRAGNVVWGLSLLARESMRGFFHRGAGGAEREHYWMRVREVAPVAGPSPVVDLFVTGSETFTTRAGAVHNCHKGGDVFTFVREVEGVGFMDAVRSLAEKYHVPLPEDDADDGESERASRQEAVYHALRFAGRWFYHVLTQTDEGAVGLRYLTERGMTPETIRAYGLGYAPDRWDGLVRAADEAGIRIDDLVDAGLVGVREKGGHYDRYRGRIVFPIFAHTGRVVGFGGRILGAKADDPKAPKYINSPQTVVYDKSRVLYGLYQGRQTVRAQEEAILVEGYMDVLAMHQAGFTNAVATCGTSLTADQVALAGRYAKRIVMLYDGDSAGLTAALKGAETAVEHWRHDADEEKQTHGRGVADVLARGLIVYMVALPPGEDPDSYIRTHGREAFERYLTQNRQDFVGFAAGVARRAGRLDTPDGTAEVLEEIVQTIARLPSPLLQQTYVRRAAEVLDIPTAALDERLGQIVRGRRAAPRATPEPDRDRRSFDAYDDTPGPASPPSPPVRTAHPEEELLLRLMLTEGAPMVEFVLGHMALNEFTEGPTRDLAAALVAQYEADDVTPTPFLEGRHGEALQRLAAQVLAEREVISKGWSERRVTIDIDPVASAAGAMKLLKLERVDAALADSTRALTSATDGAALEAAQRHHMALVDLRRRIFDGGFLRSS